MSLTVIEGAFGKQDSKQVAEESARALCMATELRRIADEVEAGNIVDCIAAYETGGGGEYEFMLGAGLNDALALSTLQGRKIQDIMIYGSDDDDE